MRRVFAPAFALVLAGAVAAAAAAAPDAETDQSSNWAGYVVIPPGSTPARPNGSLTFTDVTGTWRQPAARCTPGERSSAAVWVGLGGYFTSGTSESLEQTGTSADCDAAGRATYSIWYEIPPQPSQTVTLKLAPGDTVTASVVVDGDDVLVQVKNRTRRTSFTRHLSVAAPDLTSAEWIAEAPSECASGGNFCRAVALADFGTISFSRVAALGNGQGGTLNAPGWQLEPIELVPRGHHRFFGGADEAGSSGAGATAESPSADGRSFAIAWQSNPAAA